MRNTLLVSILAVGAFGLPNVPDYIKAEWNDLWVCNDNMNKEGRDKLHMDEWVEQFTSAWPYSLGGKEADKSKPYIRYDDPSSAFSISGGVFGVLGGIPGIGTFAGSLGGVLSLEGTIMAPPQIAAALIVQNEVHDIAKLQFSLAKIKDNARDAVWKWANKIISDPLKEKRIDEPNGWRKLLKRGAFADNIQQNWRKKFKNLHSITKQFNVFAICGASWQLDQLFVVKANNINGDLTKDYSSAKLNEFDGDCYFFVKAQSFQNLLDGKWQTVKGLKNLKDYGLKPIDVAKGAEWYKKVNGGKVTPKPADAKVLLKNLRNQKESPGKPWVSLPFIDYDEIPSTSKMYHDGYGAPSDHSHFIRLWQLTFLPLIAGHTTTIFLPNRGLFIEEIDHVDIRH